MHVWMDGLDEMTKNRGPKLLLKVQSINTNHKNYSRIRRNLISMVSPLNWMGLKRKMIFWLPTDTLFHFLISIISIDSHESGFRYIFALHRFSILTHARALFFSNIHINFIWWWKRLIFAECSKLTNWVTGNLFKLAKFIGILFKFDRIPFAALDCIHAHTHWLARQLISMCIPSKRYWITF